METKVTRWANLLIVILIVLNIVGWSLWSTQRDQIKEYQQQVEDLEQEIDNLREQNHQLMDELDGLTADLRIIYQKPLDLSGVTPSRSHSIVDLMSDSRFWNVIPGAEEFRQRDIEESYSKTLTPTIMTMGMLLAEWDILEDIASAWESLDVEGVTSVIMVGTHYLGNVTSPESDRIWLLVLWTKQTVQSESGWGIIIDPVTGKKYTPYVTIQDPRTTDGLSVIPEELMHYFKGYAYTSPSDLIADIEGR